MSTDEFRLPFTRGTLVEPEPYRVRDACDLSELETHAIGSTKPIAIDLFCGAGGLSLGLQEAGFDVILGVDHQHDALMTHGAYFGGSSHLADLSDEEEVARIARALENVTVDLIAGGPPCQPFSRANARMRSRQNRTGNLPDERAELWKTFLSVIRQVRPRAVLFENVPDLAFTTNGHVFMDIVVALEDIGYSVHSRILSSTDYGIAQKRQRLFIVAVQQGIDFKWPVPSSKNVTLRDAIDDLPKQISNETPNPTTYTPTGQHSELTGWFRRDMRPGAEAIVYDHTARRVRDDDLEIYEMMSPGEIYANIPWEDDDPRRRYGKGDDVNFKDRYNRLSWDEPCRSITAHIAKDGYWYIHPDENRTLTVRESARVQSFPDWFRFYGYPTSGFRQIGNSVPPLLSKALSEAIFVALEKNTGQTNWPGRPEDTAGLSSNDIGCTGQEGPSSFRVYRLLESREFKPEDSSSSPWLYSTDPWQLTLGIVFAEQVEGVSGYSKKNRRLRAWTRACRSWPTPADYVIYPDGNESSDPGPRQATLEEDLVPSFHPLRISVDEVKSTLQRIAEWMVKNPGEDFASGIDRHVSHRFKNEISPLLKDYQWSRLPLKVGPMRVADRIYGYEPQGTGANSRLNLARVLARARDRRMYIAFCEIADLYCSPDVPECDECPLNTTCISGSSVSEQLDHQARLPFNI